MSISPGDKVATFSFSDQEGQKYDYPADFKDQKLAIFFLRHLGCPLCKHALDDIDNAVGQFADKGVKVVTVVQSTPKRVAEYAKKEGLSMILAPDREKKLYNAFDVKRGGLKEFMGPGAFKATIRATLKGHTHGKFEGDEFQVPASFLLSGDGEALYCYYGKDVSDFGSVDAVLAQA